jgi:hypothetical protein
MGGGFHMPSTNEHVCFPPSIFKRVSYLRKEVGPFLRFLGEVIRLFVRIEK